MTYLELARRQRKWSQEDLGHHPKIRIHQNWISAFERGVGIPTADQAERLSGLLGIPAHKLIAKVPEDLSPLVSQVTADAGK